MSLLGNIWVKLGLKSDDFQRGMDNATKKAEGFGSKLGAFTARAVLGVAALAAAFVKLGRASVQAYNQQEAANRKLQNALRNTGDAIGVNYDELRRYASELQHVNGVADDATMSAMATLTTFRSVQGDVFKATIKAAQDMAAFIGTDLNSAVLQLGKALEAPEVGLTMLRRSGVVFTTEMTENIKKLVKEGKQYEAQLLILDEVNKRFGGSAEQQANTAAGAWKRVGMAFSDLAEHIGSANNATKGLADSLELAMRGLDRIINHEALNFWEKLDLVFGGFWSGKSIEKMAEYDHQMRMVNENAKKYAEDRVKGIESIEQAQAQLRREEAALAKMGDWRTQDRANTEATIAALNQLIQRKNQEAADAEEAAKKAAEEAKEAAKRHQEWMEQHSGVLNGLKDEIAAKEKLRNMATDTTEITRLNKEISLLKEKYEWLQKNNIDWGSEQLPGISDKSRNAIKNGAMPSVPIKLEIDTSGLKASQEEIDAFLKTFETQQHNAQVIADAFGNALRQGVVSAINELAEAIGTGDWDTSTLVKALLSPLADAAVSAGTLIMTTGTALEALQEAFEKWFSKAGPYGAIIAGAALVALGTAAKAGLSSIAKGGSGNTAGSSYTYTGGYGVTPAAVNSIPGELNIVVTGELKGQDIALSMERYNNNKRR